jgi:hypothetical protein
MLAEWAAQPIQITPALHHFSANPAKLPFIKRVT